MQQWVQHGHSSWLFTEQEFAAETSKSDFMEQNSVKSPVKLLSSTKSSTSLYIIGANKVRSV
jgi:hypothetical protein